MEPALSSSAAAEYFAAVRQSLGRPLYLFALRIPGRAQYLAALDDAVASAMSGKQTPAEALRQTASRWRETTKRLGQEAQKSAYVHSMGLD